MEVPHATEGLLTGAQAEAYADHFIAVHLSEMPYGGVYATISAKALANPNSTQLKRLEQVSFKGDLAWPVARGYAFGTFGFCSVSGMPERHDPRKRSWLT